MLKLIPKLIIISLILSGIYFAYQFFAPRLTPCGGIAGLQCPVGFRCQFPGDGTGRWDMMGKCAKPPQTNSTPNPTAVVSSPILTSSADLGRFQATITKSPTQPVCREGESCSGPFADEVLNIFAATGGDSVATVTTDTEGKINVTLPPGSYYLQSVTPVKMGTLPRSDFTISSGQTTTLQLEVDTGIR